MAHLVQHNKSVSSAKNRRVFLNSKVKNCQEVWASHRTQCLLSMGVFQTLIGVIYCVTRRGLVNTWSLKFMYCTLQMLPHLEQIFVKVTSTSSCFSDLDWQFDWAHNFHSWSFMICHATVASSAQWEILRSYKYPKGHTTIYHACADPLGQDPIHISFPTGTRLFLTNTSTRIPFQSGGLPSCRCNAFFFCFFTLYMHIYVPARILCWRCR